MVCPVCIIPLASGIAALTSGTIASRSKKILIVILLVLFTIISLGITVYFLVFKKQLKKKCKTCSIPDSPDSTPIVS
jgi:flagellar basal body-associated protein FliL